MKYPETRQCTDFKLQRRWPGIYVPILNIFLNVQNHYLIPKRYINEPINLDQNCCDLLPTWLPRHFLDIFKVRSLISPEASLVSVVRARVRPRQRQLLCRLWCAHLPTAQHNILHKHFTSYLLYFNHGFWWTDQTKIFNI